MPYDLLATAKRGTAPFRRATASLRTLPTFLIIGAQKAGTSSLWYYLKLHPQIKMGFPKEVEYFSRDFDQGSLQYRAHFPSLLSSRGELQVGEASPSYFDHPHAAARIANLLPEAKLLLLLRDPVTRAISHYYHSRRLGRENRPIQEALFAPDDRLVAEWTRMCDDESYYSAYWDGRAYLQRGEYAQSLQRLLSNVDRERLLVIDSARFFRDPLEVVKTSYQFLGVSDSFVPHSLQRLNAAPAGQTEAPADVVVRLTSHYREPNRKLVEVLGRSFEWTEQATSTLP